MKLYTVYDRLAQESGPLFEAKNDLVAWRMCAKFIQENPPGDFSVVCVGTYSHDPVRIWPEEEPRELVLNEFVEEVCDAKAIS